MHTEKPVTLYRKDYQQCPYSVEHLHLTFKLFDHETRVIAEAVYHRNILRGGTKLPLILDGEELELVSIAVDGRKLQGEEFSVDKKSLCLHDPPETFTLCIETIIHPEKNTSLEGLYRSNINYCTQCEAEGFRKITYYQDRPDVLTRFTTRIEADISSCPVLLSNGNCVEKGTLNVTRHYAVWEDPFLKPCYLFALVAGQLVAMTDEYVTRSGRIVELKIYVEERNKKKCAHAMNSLKNSMQWDEQTYGLEYDLDTFMIVAVDDFNMGAMENKGLNIFNSKYVLSTPETATDQDYLGIEGVIAHEYFHNWTGNRVTCRDWFQLSLKEGLTVFRDQQFSADMNSSAVQRIDDVRVLKDFQFKEDAGPMSHPVRPDSYVEVNNFYTATVYNKGAEVIRMIHCLLGKDRFRKGMDLYFARHDGQAVTCDDFVAAMSDASGVDLDQFKNWYGQAGTPVLEVKKEWQRETSEYTLRIRQHCPDTPGQTRKKPFHMPIAIGLLGQQGNDLLDGTVVFELQEKEQVFVFQNIKEQPVVSFLRDFSAPVRVVPFHTDEELALLMRYDPNLYNRWDASQSLAAKVILEAAENIRNNRPISDTEMFHQAVSFSLQATETDPALLALSLQLPQETTLAQEMVIIEPDALHKARQGIKREIATINRERLLELYSALRTAHDHDISQAAMGQRSLKNTVLNYLMALRPLPDDILSLCTGQYYNARNMTDTIAALSNLVQLDSPVRDEVFDHFFTTWQKDPLVLDKWFMLQASSHLPDTLDRVIALTSNPSFSMANPNKVRSLIGAFCSRNHVRFHDGDGRGYRFLADIIEQLDGTNPQIAARMVVPLINWKRYDEKRQEKMREQLLHLANKKDLSRDLYEIVSKSLQCCIDSRRGV